MSRLIASSVAATDSRSVIGFERAGFNRFLTLRGSRAYATGNICDTCEFFFERLDGANDKASPRDGVAERLKRGIEGLDDSLLAEVVDGLPAGEYRALLLEVAPTPVRPGAPGDYFAEEQVDLWGVDPFWDLPHDPRVVYYRTGAAPLPDRTALFEFVVPMVSRHWLNAETLKGYEDRLRGGQRPTALALAVLDVKGPAMWDGEPQVVAHSCLAHYLLDGHHKLRAAAATGCPVTLLSFLALDESIADGADVEAALGALRDQPAR